MISKIKKIIRKINYKEKIEEKFFKKKEGKQKRFFHVINLTKDCHYS